MSTKKDLSERDICTQFILPALKKSAWNIETQVNSSKINSEILMKAVLKEAFEK